MLQKTKETGNYLNMENLVKKINEGFLQKNSLALYKSLFDYFSSNIDKIFYQKHPLGFKYFSFGKINEQEEFRIHIWSEDYKCQDDDLMIHDHSFDFESFVVLGKIKNTIYSINENPDSEGYIYQVKFAENKSFLEIISDHQKISIFSEEEINEGNFYSIKSYEFHQSQNMCENSISIIKIFKSEYKPANVYSPKKPKDLLSFQRSYLGKQESKIISRRIINECQRKINSMS